MQHVIHAWNGHQKSTTGSHKKKVMWNKRFCLSSTDTCGNYRSHSSHAFPPYIGLLVSCERLLCVTNRFRPAGDEDSSLFPYRWFTSSLRDQSSISSETKDSRIFFPDGAEVSTENNSPFPTKKREPRVPFSRSDRWPQETAQARTCTTCAWSNNRMAHRKDRAKIGRERSCK